MFRHVQFVTPVAPKRIPSGSHDIAGPSAAFHATWHGQVGNKGPQRCGAELGNVDLSKI